MGVGISGIAECRSVGGAGDVSVAELNLESLLEVEIAHRLKPMPLKPVPLRGGRRGATEAGVTETGVTETGVLEVEALARATRTEAGTLSAFFSRTLTCQIWVSFRVSLKPGMPVMRMPFFTFQ